jgi:hypothetical protein
MQPPEIGTGRPSVADERPIKPETNALARRPSKPSVRRKPVKGRPPLAPASVFGPVGRRKSWWYTYRCATCGAYLFGRARDLDAVIGERRAGCGHKVQIMAARIYTQPNPGPAS